MSKLETPMTRAFWAEIGGTLIEEYLVVPSGPNQGRRLLDAIILPDGPTEIRHWKEVGLRGQNVVIVQTKASRLGMYLMGQTLFSIELVKPLKPKSIRSVALCNRDDAILRPFLESFEGCEVRVMPSIFEPKA
jgi:hypothetical protein